ncbi:hypothetical protein [Helicobacter bilis]|uniref:hypothetical protein n=1 Tax=Helicobacter bilis TaxID=37372 RepID=UPI000A8F7775|nr:hypothetical protein [Helicobacter bilis]MDY4399408.1 hypothetical protein [Helicobacter bilis]
MEKLKDLLPHCRIIGDSHTLCEIGKIQSINIEKYRQTSKDKLRKKLSVNIRIYK